MGFDELSGKGFKRTGDLADEAGRFSTGWSGGDLTATGETGNDGRQEGSALWGFEDRELGLEFSKPPVFFSTEVERVCSVESDFAILCFCSFSSS